MEVKIQEKSGGEVAEGSGKAETGAAPWICPHCGRSFKRRNQSHYCGQKPESIDEYIAAQPRELWPYLNAVRDAIRRALPEAEETISWSMPTFRKEFNIIHFAAFKNHVGLYPGTEAIEMFSERLKEYKTGKGSIQFLYSRPIPLELIAEIARWCHDTGKHP